MPPRALKSPRAPSASSQPGPCAWPPPSSQVHPPNSSPSTICEGGLWGSVLASGTPSHCPAPPHPQPQKPHPRTGGSRARQPLLELILQAREGRIRWGLGEGRASGSPDFMGPQREGSGSQWVRTGTRPCPRFAQDPPSMDRVSPPSWGPLGPEMLGALRTGPGGWTGRSC